MLISNFSIVLASQDIEKIETSLETITDKIDLGLINKKIGDHYVLQGEYKKAADANCNALSINNKFDIILFRERIGEKI